MLKLQTQEIILINNEYSIDQEVNNNVKIIMEEVTQYLKLNGVCFSHKKRTQTDDDQTKYSLDEEGLFFIIFGYLPYNEIIEHIYPLNGTIHEVVISFLNQRYPQFLYCETIRDLLDLQLKSMHSELLIRKDAVIIANILIMTFITYIIDQLNDKYLECKDNNEIFEDQNMQNLIINLLKDMKIDLN